MTLSSRRPKNKLAADAQASSCVNQTRNRENAERDPHRPSRRAAKLQPQQAPQENAAIRDGNPIVGVDKVDDAHLPDGAVVHDGELSAGNVHPDMGKNVSERAHAEKQQEQHRRRAVSVYPFECGRNVHGVESA